MWLLSLLMELHAQHAISNHQRMELIQVALPILPHSVIFLSLLCEQAIGQLAFLIGGMQLVLERTHLPHWEDAKHTFRHFPYTRDKVASAGWISGGNLRRYLTQNSDLKSRNSESWSKVSKSAVATFDLSCSACWYHSRTADQARRSRASWMFRAVSSEMPIFCTQGSILSSVSQKNRNSSKSSIWALIKWSTTWDCSLKCLPKALSASSPVCSPEGCHWAEGEAFILTQVTPRYTNEPK